MQSSPPRHAGFKATAEAFFLFVIIYFQSLTIYTFLGQLLVYLVATAPVASLFGSLSHTVWTVFNGYLQPRPLMAVGWWWINYTSATTWVIYAIGASQLGDQQSKIVPPGGGLGALPARCCALYIRTWSSCDRHAEDKLTVACRKLSLARHAPVCMLLAEHACAFYLTVVTACADYPGCSESSLGDCPTLAQWTEDYFGYKYNFRWWCVLILFGFMTVFRVGAMLTLKLVSHDNR